MANLASILKSEIARVARKEVRSETLALKKAVGVYRGEIAALKRRAQALEQQVRRHSRQGTTGPIKLDNDEPESGRRFSAKGLRSQRIRLGISAAECGLLLGASAQSIYNWEQGKARPSARHMPGVSALKSLGKRDAATVIAARR